MENYMIQKRITSFLLIVLITVSFTACSRSDSKEASGIKTYKEDKMEGIFWPESSVLPSFGTPAENLDAFNTFGKSSPVVTMMVSLQGILNKSTPRLLVFGDNYRSERWPEEMGLTYTLESDEYSLITKYLNEIEGLVIFDATVPDTMNLATTVAGLKNALVVTPVLAEVLKKEPYSLPVLEDYTGKFTDKYEVYDYALTHVFPECNKRLMIGLNPALGSGHNGFLRDLAAASGSMVIWLNPIDVNGSEKNYENKELYEKDLEYLKKFFDQCSSVDTYYIGWWPEEGIGIRESSKYGIPTIPADFFENMTVYAGLPKEFTIPTVPKKPELENKFYLAFMFSDGDNAQYCEHFLKTNSNSWSSPMRGQFPITWTMAPALIDMAPQMLNYFYKTATENDYIVAGPSGFGYTDPAKWSKENFKKYVQVTNTYFSKSAFNFITVWNFLPYDKGKIFEENMPSLIGLSVQERYTEQLRTETFNDRLSLITAIPRYDGDYERVLNIIKDEIRRSDKNKPKFWISQLIAWELGVSDVISMADAIKEEFGDYVEFVRADQLMMLYNEYHHIPYNISLRGDVTTSSSDVGFVSQNLVDGSFSSGWQTSEQENVLITIDLKKEYLLHRYVIKNAETAYWEKELNTKEFEVLVSTDGTTFTPIDKVTENVQDIVDQTVSSVTARYVRFHIIDPGNDGVTRVQELELYGVPLTQ